MCEATPGNLQFADLLIELFPEARCLCLYRNCLDVVHASLQAGRYGFPPDLADHAARHPRDLVTAMVEAWTEATERLLDIEAAHAASCHRIKYEDFAAHPRATLASIVEFLGVSANPDPVRRVVEAEDGHGEDPAEDLVGRGSSIRRELIPDDWRDRMNRTLARLDYPTVDEDWNDRPSPYLARGASQDAAVPTGVEP